jgi:hypothetical protein
VAPSALRKHLAGLKPCADAWSNTPHDSAIRVRLPLGFVAAAAIVWLAALRLGAVTRVG